MKKVLFAALPLLAGALTPMLAQAELSCNVALTSIYKFRGQDQDTLASNGFAKTRAFKPAIQGGCDYGFADTGFYVGNWNSNVNFIGGNSIEADLYGGYKFKAGPFDLDVGVLTYVYPGNSAPNTTEVYGAATFTDEAMGAITTKYSHTVSRDYFNYAGTSSGSGLSGRNTGYLNVAYSKLVAPQVTFKAAVGYTRMNSDMRELGYKSYFDYSVGASYDFGSGLALAGAVQGANRQSAYRLATANSSISINKPRLVVALSKTF